MRIVLFVFILIVGSAAAADKAEIVEIPAAFKTVAVPAPLKCEGGSCWVYHGTADRVNFFPVSQCWLRGTTGDGAIACTQFAHPPATLPARVYCSKPALECRSREVVSNDSDWRSGR